MATDYSPEIRHAMAKITKADARYTPDGTEAEHCGICSHYEPPLCERIQGRVVAGGWCRLFHKAASK